MASKKNQEGLIDKLLGLFGLKRPKHKQNESVSYHGRITEIQSGNNIEEDGAYSESQANVPDESLNGFNVDLDPGYEETPAAEEEAKFEEPVVAEEPMAAEEPESEEDAYVIEDDRDYYSDSSHKQINPYSNTMQETGPVLGDDFEIISTPVSGKKKMQKKKKRSVGRNIGRSIVAAMLILIIAVCLIAGGFMIYVFAAVDGTLDNDLNNLKLAYTSIVYAKDKDGKDIELTRLHGEENRLWVDLKDLPKDLKYAFVSAEDKRFYQHDGVDWKRTFSAFVNLFVHIYDTKQGGSSITQQLVKNITGDDEQSAMRKVQEIMRARYVEEKYSKDTIIECYLNTIHLGNGVDGIEVAATYYFDKNASKLSLNEIACLAALTKSPSGFDPYKHPEENKSRRNWVLSEMLANGYISQAEYDKAVSEELKLRKEPSTILSSAPTVKEKYNSYFVDAVIEDVISGLMKDKDYSYEYAEKMLYQGGYKIYTTVDMDIQKHLEEVYNDDDNFTKVTGSKDKNQKPNSSICVMDYNGHVVGIVGGRGAKTGNRTLNRATQSPRQPGSAIKPLTVYAPAIEYNLLTYGSKVLDEPINTVIDGKKTRWPQNYSGYYSGKVSATWALEQSLNTVPVRLIQEMGERRSFDFLTKNLGVTNYKESVEVNGEKKTDINLSSLAVGGSLYGVTTRELSAAYAAFGNLGYYWEPTTYTKVLDQKNEVVLKQQDRPKSAMSEDTANVMNKMLQRVTQNGTGSPAQYGDWPIISKTGTTSDTKDRWFVGGTPYYVASVWFGYDTNENMRISGTNPALKVWNAAMRPIHKNLELKDFPESSSCKYMRYCNSSGKVATSGCYSVSYGWFKGGYQPTCDIHSGVKLDPVTKPKPVGSKSDDSSDDTTTKKNNNNNNNNDDDDDVPIVDVTERPKTTSPNNTKPTETKAQPTEKPTERSTVAIVTTAGAQ